MNKRKVTKLSQVFQFEAGIRQGRLEERAICLKIIDRELLCRERQLKGDNTFKTEIAISSLCNVKSQIEAK